MKNLLFILIVCCLSCNEVDSDGIKVTVSAYYMQYACGDWNDDMQIRKIDNKSLYQLVGKDIDPIFENGEDELSDLFHLNKSDEFGLEYKLTGIIDTTKHNGCDNNAMEFVITRIEKINGDDFIMTRK